jgi:hypothetical protein
MTAFVADRVRLIEAQWLESRAPLAFQAVLTIRRSKLPRQLTGKQS